MSPVFDATQQRRQLPRTYPGNETHDWGLFHILIKQQKASQRQQQSDNGINRSVAANAAAGKLCHWQQQQQHPPLGRPPVSVTHQLCC